MKSRKGFVSNSSTSSFILLTDKTSEEVCDDFINIFKAMYQASGFEKFKELSEDFYDLPILIETGSHGTVEVSDHYDNGIPHELKYLIEELFVAYGGFGYDMGTVQKQVKERNNGNR